MSVPPERRETQTRVSPDKRPGVGLESRNPILGRVSTEDMTTLEKIWGKMFDDGQPTPRLGQLLRGIAVHLVCTPHWHELRFLDTNVNRSRTICLEIPSWLFRRKCRNIMQIPRFQRIPIHGRVSPDSG
jgi:hypothetical protein